QEKDHPLRTEFQRDKDRIVHSLAFRRLEYKTQVFVSGQGDHFRTRLTHTIEVSGISRTISRALGLNEDLAESSALAHDIGHPPFGHCGEDELNELLKEHGGFDHNKQALKTVDELEDKYTAFKGLNLSWELRASLCKHRDRQAELDGIKLPKQNYLEAQVSNLADSITYYSHDMDDGLLAGLITVDQLKKLKFWQMAAEHADLPSSTDYKEIVPYMIRASIDMQVADAVQNSHKRLIDSGIKSADAALDLDEPLIQLSQEMYESTQELRTFLYEKMYWHERVLSANKEAVRMMRELFQYFIKHPDDVGSRSRKRIEEVGLYPAVGDYIAMMTDRYAIEQYNEFV
ncbi:MAG: dNTP triphosphohydrolase, partial [Lentisphaeria bacterium]|nr:dNTP triphosphohydrolase [Lentisphaeria bacterium]